MHCSAAVQAVTHSESYQGYSSLAVERSRQCSINHGGAVSQQYRHGAVVATAVQKQLDYSSQVNAVVKALQSRHPAVIAVQQYLAWPARKHQMLARFEHALQKLEPTSPRSSHGLGIDKPPPHPPHPTPPQGQWGAGAGALMAWATAGSAGSPVGAWIAARQSSP